MNDNLKNISENDYVEWLKQFTPGIEKSTILKDEFYLDQTFTSVVHAKKAAKNAIKLYNSKRLHLSLDYKIPNYVHQYAT